MQMANIYNVTTKSDSTFTEDASKKKTLTAQLPDQFRLTHQCSMARDTHPPLIRKMIWPKSFNFCLNLIAALFWHTFPRPLPPARSKSSKQAAAERICITRQMLSQF